MPLTTVSFVIELHNYFRDIRCGSVIESHFKCHAGLIDMDGGDGDTDGGGGGDDFLDDLMGSDDASSPPTPAALELLPKHKIAPKVFQANWSKATGERVAQTQLANTFSPSSFEGALKGGRIFILMSGKLKGGAVVKYFFFATDTENNLYMLKILFEKASRRMKATCKSQSARLDEFFVRFKALLGCS